MEEIRRGAEERIAALREREASAARRRRDEALARHEAALRAETARDLAELRRDGRRRVLEARDALLERVFARARERLPDALERPTARERLVERAREALARVPAAGAVVACSPGLAEPLTEGLGGDEVPPIETRDDLPPGFRVEAAGGALVVDATLETLMELERPTLAIEILRRLGGAPAS